MPARRAAGRRRIDGVRLGVVALLGAALLGCNGIAGIDEPRHRRAGKTVTPCEPVRWCDAQGHCKLEDTCDDNGGASAGGGGEDEGGSGGGEDGGSSGDGVGGSSGDGVGSSSSGGTDGSGAGGGAVAGCPVSVPDVATSAGVTISGLTLNGGTNVATVARGDRVEIAFNATIVDCGCPTCTNQIQIGLLPGGVLNCVYSGVPGCAGDAGSATLPVVAPATSGVYYLHFDQSQAEACPREYWGLTQPDVVVGALCVR